MKFKQFTRELARLQSYKNTAMIPYINKNARCQITTTDGEMEYVLLCLLLLTGAQGLSIYGGHGKRGIPGTEGKSDSVTNNNLILIS